MYEENTQQPACPRPNIVLGGFFVVTPMFVGPDIHIKAPTQDRQNKQLSLRNDIKLWRGLRGNFKIGHRCSE
jgi:hypothetical protein